MIEWVIQLQLRDISYSFIQWSLLKGLRNIHASSLNFLLKSHDDPSLFSQEVLYSINTLIPTLWQSVFTNSSLILSPRVHTRLPVKSFWLFICSIRNCSCVSSRSAYNSSHRERTSSNSLTSFHINHLTYTTEYVCSLSPHWFLLEWSLRMWSHGSEPVAPICQKSEGFGHVTLQV